MLSEINRDQRTFVGESAEARLAAAGLELPPAVAPFGAYVPAVRIGNLLFLSGMPHRYGSSVEVEAFRVGPRRASYD